MFIIILACTALSTWNTGSFDAAGFNGFYKSLSAHVTYTPICSASKSVGSYIHNTTTDMINQTCRKFCRKKMQEILLACGFSMFCAVAVDLSIL